MLTVKQHITITTLLLFGLFILGIWLYESFNGFIITQGLNKYFFFFGFFFLLLVIPLFIFDRFVPSKCPQCNGKMYGEGDAYRFGRNCKDCGYKYSW